MSGDKIPPPPAAAAAAAAAAATTAATTTAAAAAEAGRWQLKQFQNYYRNRVLFDDFNWVCNCCVKPTVTRQSKALLPRFEILITVNHY